MDSAIRVPDDREIVGSSYACYSRAQKQHGVLQRQEIHIDDASWGDIMDFATEHRGKSARALFAEAVSPSLESLREDFETGF
ncbi:hypothetical protein HYFRA_00001670 [Hymenoscyphus fraxineus]|uniref:Uncharacterized protein n=1 Tax=Hymenoscyphus fraxineus TaxID=746836 RepID=A0A9N9L7Z9_9HELO|nr:hypothetical protein HYFRA_00001670 [Hymenoscyphus fraxineus]